MAKATEDEARRATGASSIFATTYKWLRDRGELIGTYLKPIVSISTSSANCYKGNQYEVNGYGTIANNASKYFLAKTNQNRLYFNGFAFNSTAGNILIELLEAPTVTANGTAITPANTNREIVNIATSNIYVDPTITTQGTQLFAKKVLSIGAGAHTAEGIALDSLEWVLKADTNYAIKITNSSDISVDFAVVFNFYEK